MTVPLPEPAYPAARLGLGDRHRAYTDDEMRAYGDARAAEAAAEFKDDAERYRWLRGNGWAEPAIYVTGPKEWGANGVALLAGPELDACIDGAMVEARPTDALTKASDWVAHKMRAAAIRARGTK